ncbi:MAG: hypothetical protein RLZZ360_739 [Candidatus Parcubacteria bacterium]|jgi:glycosyltransferase involved in cell wall biosynthesis
MKIVSISHYYTPHVGGLEIVTENQVQSLVTHGHEVSVVTCASSDEVAGSTVVKGVSVYRAKVWNFFDTRFGIPFPIVGFGYISKSFTVIRQADAVHLHDVFYMSSWFALLWAFVLRKPIILTQHVAMVPHPSKVVMKIQKIVYAIFGKLLFAYATMIVVYNPQVRDFLLRYSVPAAKILLIHNGIETKAFNKKFGFDVATTRRDFGLPLNRKLVLFVGRLVPKKGYDILYAARDESFDLVYVGSGEVPKEWQAEPNFHFLGPKTQAELTQLYQAVDLFVFPAEGEMFTLVMQEAMASGLPIIATAEPGYLEYDIDRNLLVLCERSGEVFRQHILAVLSDTERLEAMSQYSMQLSKRYFDWETNSASVLALYDSLQKSIMVPN